jgi:ligand-binding sensor domain-containing protein/signal transduction histidine kinase
VAAFAPIVALAIAATQGTTPPEGRFSRYSTDQGLSESSAEVILQDRRGFIWVGTTDGLNRFDGYEFRIYRNDPTDPKSLSDDSISDLLEDSAGRLWVGTERGLNRYDRDADRFVRFRYDPADPTSLSNDLVLCLFEAQDGALWVGTYYGLNRLDHKTGRFTRYFRDPSDEHSLGGNQVLDAVADRDGSLWVGSLGGGLSRLDPDRRRFERFRHDPKDPGSLSHDDAEALLVDREGRLWVGTNGGGLNRFEPATGRFIHYRHDPEDPDSLGSDRVAAVLEDGRGQLWVGTDGGGLNLRHEDRWVHYRHSDSDDTSLASDVVRSIYEDRNGDLWVGNYAGGVHFLDRCETGFRHLGRNRDGTGLTHNSVLSLHEDEDSTLWVGTEGGLNRIDRHTGRITRYAHDARDPRSLSANAVLSIERDQEGRLWVGTFFGGLNRLDETTGGFIHLQPDEKDPGSLSSPHVWGLLEDSRGRLWIATFGGLNRLDPGSGRFVRYRHDVDDAKSLAHDVVWTVYEDRSGRIWVGSQGGLSLYQPEIDAFQNHVGASDLNVYTIHQDRGGALWVGTDGGGLQRIEPETGTATAFGIADGLPSKVVTGILEDALGSLWLGTNQGISRFDPQTGSSKSYDRSSGLQGNQFNRSACLKTRAGEMVFGGIHGMNSFFPDQVQDNPRVPPVLITDFRVLNRPVAPGPGSPLDRHITEASRITLSHGQSVLSFEFAALGFRNPSRNRYRYTLEGFDADWVDAGTRRTTTYTNLDPGRYTFRVTGSNDSGVWNQQGASLEVVVEPPFWATWWFRWFGVLALGSTLLGGHRLRTRYILARNLALEREVAERRRAEAGLSAINQELERKHAELERFTYTVSHELKSPLVTIQGFLGYLDKDLTSGQGDRVQKDMKRISDATEKLRVVLDELLELSRVGRRANPPEEVSMAELAHEVCEMLAVQIAGRGVTVKVDPQLPAVHGDRTALREVLLNLVENAVKFMGDQPHPRIEIGGLTGPSGVTCHVRDNGVGIPARYHERVFELFEQLAPGEGTGVGLALVRRIVEEHGGRVWVESEGAGCGACFCFTIPDRPRAAGPATSPEP